MCDSNYTIFRLFQNLGIAQIGLTLIAQEQFRKLVERSVCLVCIVIREEGIKFIKSPTFVFSMCVFSQKQTLVSTADPAFQIMLGLK